MIKTYVLITATNAYRFYSKEALEKFLRELSDDEVIIDVYED